MSLIKDDFYGLVNEEEDIIGGIPPFGPHLFSFEFGTPIQFTRTLFDDVPWVSGPLIVNQPVLGGSQTINLASTGGVNRVQAFGTRQATVLVMSGGGNINITGYNTLQEFSYGDLENEHGRFSLVLGDLPNIGGGMHNILYFLLQN